MILNNASNLKYIDVESPKFNLSIGTNAGNTSISGSFNTLLGSVTGSALTTGSNNSFYGYFAGNSFDVGNSNCSFGFEAAKFETGDNNSGFGKQALLRSLSSFGNTALGSLALAGLNAPASNNNIGIGFGAGATCGASTGNILIGADTDAPTNSSNCIAIGFSATISALSNCIAIGANAIASADNVISIGYQITPQTPGTIYIGQYGTSPFYSQVVSDVIANASVSGVPVEIDLDHVLGIGLVVSLESSQHISDIGDQSSKIWDLRPVSFTQKDDPNNTMRWGIIPHEAHAVMPELVHTYPKNGPLRVRTQDLPILLLNEMKKMKKEIEELKAKLQVN